MENQKSAPVYQVVEKFVSINGEGRRAGELAVFIRMKGCNLHCSYCDTYWANESDCESTEMTADEIISYIEESRIRNITLTGGEPLLREGMRFCRIRSGAWRLRQTEALILRHIAILKEGRHLRWITRCRRAGWSTRCF